MYKSEVKGKGCIVARVVADSLSPAGKRITTMEVEFQRFILSEYNTHGALSKNASSSRAISILDQLVMISEQPAMPIFYGEDKKGMQAESAISSEKQKLAESIILEMRDFCVEKVKQLKQECNLHKQTANRYIEAFQVVKGVVTFTEGNNFFALRMHDDAQPEIHELAKVMKQAIDCSTPDELQCGEWHLPYVDKVYNDIYDYVVMVNNENQFLTLEEAIKVSASCCAQVSYRILDQGLEKALTIYDQLVNGKPVHASPFEHQAKVMENNLDTSTYEPWRKDYLEDGITHQDRSGELCSGNFKGWIQNRQLIKDNVVKG